MWNVKCQLMICSSTNVLDARTYLAISNDPAKHRLSSMAKVMQAVCLLFQIPAVPRQEHLSWHMLI